MIRSRALALLLLALLVVATACSGDMESAGDSAAPTDHVESDSETSEETDYAEDADSGGDDTTGIGGGDGSDQAAPLPPATPAATRNPERVIREGTMTIEVADGEFRTAFARVVQTARELGGASVSSSARTHDDGSTAGTVTIRVPVERYDELLTGMDRIGTLRSQDISSTDVTAEYTDLESRVRHAKAQEAFYLQLLEEAQGVQDAIAVKQQLDSIQAEIEQAQGRLNVLADRTSFSTLTVEIVEPGTAPAVTAFDERPTLGAYVATARDGFVTVVGAMIVVSVSLAPLVIPVLLLLAAWRAYARRPRTATVTADQA